MLRAGPLLAFTWQQGWDSGESRVMSFGVWFEVCNVCGNLLFLLDQVLESPLVQIYCVLLLRELHLMVDCSCDVSAISQRGIGCCIMGKVVPAAAWSDLLVVPVNHMDLFG